MTKTNVPKPSVPLDQLPLNTGISSNHLDAAQRLDPYWGELWGGRAAAVLNTWSDVNHAARASGRPLAARDRRATPQQARLQLRNLHHSLHHRRLMSLSFIAAYGAMTNQQLAAFMDTAEIARHATDLDLAFIAGLVTRGWPAGSNLARRNSRCPIDIYAPGSNHRAMKSVFDGQFVEAVHCGVTDRLRWKTASHHPRHDVLAAELALRIAEGVGPHIALVLGETSARLADVATHHPDVAKTIGERHADLLLYRDDDLPIAVEITANVGENFRDKLDAYAEALAYRDRDDDGYAVLFVEAAHPNKSNAMNTAIRAQVKKVATRHADSRYGDRVAARLFYVRWADWFPKRGQVDPHAFTRLRAERVIAGRWTHVDLIDRGEVAFNPLDEFVTSERIASRHLTWAIPRWQRNESYSHPFAEPLVAARIEAWKQAYLWT